MFSLFFVAIVSTEEEPSDLDLVMSTKDETVKFSFNDMDTESR